MTESGREAANTSASRYVWSGVLLVGTAWLLYRVRGTFPIFLLGFFLAYAMSPLLHWLQSRGLRRSQAVQILVSVFVACVVVTAFIVIPLIIGQVQDFERQYQASYRSTIRTWTSDWERRVDEITPERLRPLIFETSPDGTYLPEPSAGGAPAPTPEPAPAVRRVHFRPEITDWLHRVRNRVLPRVASAIAAWVQHSIGGLVLLVILPVITYYFMLIFDPLRRRVLYLVPDAERPRFLAIAQDVNQTLSIYVRSQLFLGAMYSVAAMLILGLWGLIFGMRFTFILGLFAGGLYLVPWVGMALNVLIGGTIGLLTGSHHVLTGILTAGTYLLLNFAFDNLLAPRLMGRRLGLHPLVILFALLAGGEFGGILGVLIAVPLAAAIKAVLVHLIPRIDEPVPAEVEALVPAPDLNRHRREPERP